MTSLGCIAIKVADISIDIEKFTELVFDTFADEATGYPDTRQDQHFCIVKTKDNFIWFESSWVTDEIFYNGQTERLNRIYEFFNKPAFMIALNEYDSGGTYGYVIIENGQIIRKRRTICYDTTIDEGEPLPLEKDWLSGKKIIADFDEDGNLVEIEGKKTDEEIEDEDLVRAVVNPVTNEVVEENELTQILHKKVMIHFFGYTIWDRLEYDFYKCYTLRMI
ncbi:hypothetical protein [Emticicia soli]|uniref:WG repeat-containing protein n=1 Tax=Emticicia soli TaxID=2027878 RepID=A0ABW5JE34_9BACT